MGRSTTPTFIIRLTANFAGSGTIAWDTKRNGKPTVGNLITWRKTMNASFNLGGVNEHVTKSLGYIPRYTAATLLNQKTGVEIASDKDGAFQVI